MKFVSFAIFLKTQTPSKHYRERERESPCDRCGVPISGATQNIEKESDGQAQQRSDGSLKFKEGDEREV